MGLNYDCKDLCLEEVCPVIIVATGVQYARNTIHNLKPSSHFATLCRVEQVIADFGAHQRITLKFREGGSCLRQQK